MILYLETSALLRAAVFNQREVLARMEGLKDWATSALTLVECERVLISMKHRRVITARIRAAALAFLREVTWRMEISELDAAIFDRTTRPFPVEPIKTLDGLHMATILSWAERGAVEVLTCDRQVKVNAEAVGLPVSYFAEEP